MRLRGARIVVVAEEVAGRLLVDRFHRIDIAHVKVVGSTDEAVAICTAGGADACVVTIRNFLVEAPQSRTDETRPPAVPSVLLADVVTPAVRRNARRSGYSAAASMTLPPRLLYRLIGGAMQKARQRRFGQAAGDRPPRRTTPAVPGGRLRLGRGMPPAGIDLSRVVGIGPVKLSS